MDGKATFWRRGKLVLRVLFIGVPLFLVVRVYLNLREPEVTFPPPAPLPSPNAYDRYMAAIPLLKHREEIAEMNRASPRRTFSRAERERMLRDNAPVLRLMRQGLLLPYREPTPKRSINTLYPHYVRFRTMASALVLEGNLKAERGDLGGAADSYGDAVAMGYQVPRGGFLIARLVGHAMQGMGRRGLWKIQTRLPAGAAKKAARRLEKLTAGAHPYSETLTEEKYMAQALLLEVLHGDTGYLEPAPGEPAEGQKRNENTGNVVLALLSVGVGKETMMGDMTRYADSQIAASRKPYALRAASLAPPKGFRYTYVQIFGSVYEQATLKQVNGEETQNALLTVALALRAHKAERGAYPKTLDALVPAYLAKVPADPFAVSGPLRYERKKAGYALWSIGPDAKNNGGKPINNPNKTGNARFFVDKHSRGDIAAGVNFY